MDVFRQAWQPALVCRKPSADMVNDTNAQFRKRAGYVAEAVCADDYRVHDCVLSR